MVRPCAGAKVHWSLTRDADWRSLYGNDYDPDDDTNADLDGSHRWYGGFVDEGDATLDAQGRATVTYQTGQKKPQRKPAKKRGRHPANDDTAEGDATDDNSDDSESSPTELRYTLSARVTDDAKREGSGDGDAPVSAGAFVLTVAPEGYVAAPGKPLQVIARAVGHDGKPVAGVSVTLKAERTRWEKAQKTSVSEQIATPLTAKTGTNGAALLTLTPPHSGAIAPYRNRV